MNHRIKELAEQAGITTNIDTDYFEKDMNKWVDYFSEKFAELIVRECIKEIEFQYGGGSDQPMDNEWDRAVECVSSMVKYRFGVEE